MTEIEKVKKWFKTELSMREEESLDSIECEDMMDICVKALEELQQYRAIGTVEEISKLIKFLSYDDDTSILEDLRMLIEYRAIGTVEDYWKLNEMCKEYSAIGTIDEFKALKEKNEPKKPNGISMKYGDYFGSCPICNRSATNYLNMPYKYCPKCGQKFDWQ